MTIKQQLAVIVLAYLLAVVLTLVTPAHAQDWGRYGNRYVPPVPLQIDFRALNQAAEQQRQRELDAQSKGVIRIVSPLTFREPPMPPYLPGFETRGSMEFVLRPPPSPGKTP